MKFTLLAIVFVLAVLPAMAQSPSERKAVLAVVHRFFDALEKRDTAAFHAVFIEGGGMYYAVGTDSVRIGARVATQFRFNATETIKERMRDKGVEVRSHRAIANVWAPYDLWINDVFSHCGVDVFTLLKTNAGWKIASIAFTIEKDACR